MRFPPASLFFAVLAVFCLLGVGTPIARAAEPLLKPNDVIALVGGEDMVTVGEYGYLELLLTRALPEYHLRIRNLAWEGDTVFEQHRDLNFPSWEEQLDKVGATVVLANFGQMESLAGKDKLPEFMAAYEKLLERFRGGGKRRIIAIAWNATANGYAQAIAEKAAKSNGMFVSLDPSLDFAFATGDAKAFRDSLHLNRAGHEI